MIRPTSWPPSGPWRCISSGDHLPSYVKVAEQTKPQVAKVKFSSGESMMWVGTDIRTMV